MIVDVSEVSASGWLRLAAVVRRLEVGLVRWSVCRLAGCPVAWLAGLLEIFVFEQPEGNGK